MYQYLQRHYRLDSQRWKREGKTPAAGCSSVLQHFSPKTVMLYKVKASQLHICSTHHSMGYDAVSREFRMLFFQQRTKKKNYTAADLVVLLQLQFQQTETIRCNLKLYYTTVFIYA